MSLDLENGRTGWVLTRLDGTIVGIASHKLQGLFNRAELQAALWDWARDWASGPAGAPVLERRLSGTPPGPALLLKALPMFDPTATQLSAPPAWMMISIEAVPIRQKQSGAGRAQFEFTPAEMRVAELVARGETPREIATALGLSIHTVRSHVKRLLAKTGVHSQSKLVYELSHRARDLFGTAGD